MSQYVWRLRRAYGGELSLDEARAVVDRSMGKRRLTDLLYESRNEGAMQMAVFYLDASAVLKRYRTEKGTDVVEELYSGPGILLTSHLTCVEVESVASRARRGTILDEKAYEALLGAFGRDLDSRLRLLPVGGDTLANASELVRDVPLRALDAIHFATITETRRQYAIESVVFVGSDRELLAACRDSQIDTLDPEAEGAMEELKKYRG